MLPTAALEYDLPPRLIAVRPAQPRDSARLLVISRSDPALMEHRTVRDLPEFLRAGDTLLFNASRVIPARLQGRRRDTGGAVDGLYLQSDEAAAARWRVMLRSNGRLREGAVIDLHDARGSRTFFSLRLIEKIDDGWSVEVRGDGDAPADRPAAAVLEQIGATPLPPYILKARRDAHLAEPDARDRAWYQTVYAAADRGASVAAPTAGLHFTPKLLAAIDRRGVRRLEISLDVGAGTFKPVECEFVEDHPIHAERYFVPGPALCALADRPPRLFAIGTTTARAIESVPDAAFADPQALQTGYAAATRLLITPGYEWRFVRGMMTNFHLPRSTLLAMVAALLPEGIDRLLEVYQEAIRREYRFYSYGDAMLILP